jgi:hypothetical protein
MERKNDRILEHVPLIDKNARGNAVIPMTPYEVNRYNERIVTAGFNSRYNKRRVWSQAGHGPGFPEGLSLSYVWSFGSPC